MKVVGYADRLSVEPGAAIAFMVSSQEPRFRADLVRLIHGNTDPSGPGFKAEPVESAVSGDYDGKEQPLRPGSCVRVPHDPRLALDGSFTIQLWLYPTTPEKEEQTLLAGPGYALRLDRGRLALSVGGRTVALETPAEPRLWYLAVATYDAETREATVSLEPLEPTAPPGGRATARDVPPPSGGTDDLLLGRSYNGKLEAPQVFAETELVAAWDFSADISSRHVRDVSGNELHGRTVNMPMRGATGRAWDGSEVAWRHAPEQYGAIHFHDDDLDDAGWDESLSWTVPDDLPSGVYAVRLRAGGEEDYVPFAVRPNRGRPTARIAFLMPTFSYLAYANEQMLAAPGAIESFERMFGETWSVDYPSQPQDKYIVENRLLSLYDRHSDGSGVVYSSRRRPLLNMRPSYDMSLLNLGNGSPHQFDADLCLVDWLHEKGFEFDVITDEDLHLEGAELIEPYDVLLTGSHHEYWSGEMLDAVESYLVGGGRMMYLAGNGFYWVTQLDPEEGHTVEIRRLGPATRAWEPAPGEGYLSTSGELGGLWRHRGRAPQRLVGVGFTAQGSGPGRPFVRQPGSFDARAAFIFEGVGDDELIGDFPCLINGYGAGGFELDRVDDALGTPRGTLVLATATGFDDSYQHVSEEVLMSDSFQGGSVNPLVRADMVYLEYPNGGAVFTPGSIHWCGSLSFNAYDNNVSRITENVLRRFATPDSTSEGAH